MLVPLSPYGRVNTGHVYSCIWGKFSVFLMLPTPFCLIISCLNLPPLFGATSDWTQALEQAKQELCQWSIGQLLTSLFSILKLDLLSILTLTSLCRPSLDWISLIFRLQPLECWYCRHEPWPRSYHTPFKVIFLLSYDELSQEAFIELFILHQLKILTFIVFISMDTGYHT